MRDVVSSVYQYTAHREGEGQVKIRWLIITATLLLAIAGSLQAMPASLYFVQDDFEQTFGATGNPGSANTEIYAWGKLVRWDVNQVIGVFELTCKTTNGAVDNGTQWVTNYDQGTITIMTKSTNGTLLWSGNVSFVQTIANKNGSMFSALPYTRPTYDSEPSAFMSIGSAQFTRTAGSWTDSAIGMSWLGTYNWNYDAEDIADATWMSGNLQGKLVAVPEPSSLAACLAFLAPLAARIRRKQQ